MDCSQFNSLATFPKNERIITQRMSKRFTDLERVILKEIVLRHKNIVECKKSDAVSIVKKRQEWELITAEYNSYDSVNARTSGQLRKAWENLKSRNKARLAAEQRSLLSAGSGPPETSTTPDSIDEQGNIKLEIPGFVDSGIPFESEPVVIKIEQEGMYPFECSTPAPVEEEEDESSQDRENPAEPNGGPKVFCNATETMENILKEEAQLRRDRALFLLESEKRLGAMREKEQKLKTEEQEMKTRLQRIKLLAASQRRRATIPRSNMKK